MSVAAVEILQLRPLLLAGVQPKGDINICRATAGPWD